MLILKENEVCALATQCQYNSNNNCFGARSGRANEFICDYVKDGMILDGQPARLPGDQTGRMKVIMD